jgi:hypothetical protein
MTSSVNSVSRDAVAANYRPLTCTDSVSEGGLEPLAYVLAAGEDPWLRV